MLLVLTSTACASRAQSTAPTEPPDTTTPETPPVIETPPSVAEVPAKPPVTVNADDGEPFKFATWNIQNFGPTKATDPARLAIIVETIEQFDFVAVQEVSDVKEQAPQILLDAINKEGDQYAMLLSPRSGQQTDDKSSQEQYLFLYKKAMFEPVGDGMLYDDSASDHFQREPWLAQFKRTGTTFDFVVATVHTAPGAAVDEIGALHDVVTWAKTKFSGEDTFIVVGDYNAGCTYAKPAQLDALDIRGKDYVWIVPDDADTNVAQAKCAYDRIVVTLAGEQHYDDAWAVEPGNVVKSISDHYPVWANFKP